MKTFCPICENETDCNFDAELYSCNECEEDFASYEKLTTEKLYKAYKFYLHFFALYIKNNEILADDWTKHKKIEKSLVEVDKILNSKKIYPN